MSIDQEEKSIEFLQAEYNHKLWQYLHALEKQDRFLQEQMPEFTQIMTSRNRSIQMPSSGTALSEPITLTKIKEQDAKSFITDIMRELCS
jgi:hypothetical protein